MRNAIEQSLQTLRAGGVILYPTDTIWGLGCDPTNESAVQRIFEIKKRADAQSLLLLVDQPGRIAGYVNEIPDIAWDLMEVAHEPLTIIYSGAKNLSPGVIASDGSVGIRVAHDPFCQRLIERFKKPLVSTSANIHGQPSPKAFDEISEELRDAVDYVAEWRQNEAPGTGKPSSIIKVGVGGEIQIIRK